MKLPSTMYLRWCILVGKSSRIVVAHQFRTHTGSALHASRTGDVSEHLPFLIYFRLLTQLYNTLGNVEDTPEKASAIDIIERCKQSSNDYKTLSEDDQGVLLTLLQENHDTRDTGVVGKPQVQLQDIRTTMDKVAVEVRLHHFADR